jgi:hypothetical protein
MTFTHLNLVYKFKIAKNKKKSPNKLTVLILIDLNYPSLKDPEEEKNCDH